MAPAAAPAEAFLAGVAAWKDVLGARTGAVWISVSCFSFASQWPFSLPCARDGAVFTLSPSSRARSVWYLFAKQHAHVRPCVQGHTHKH